MSEPLEYSIVPSPNDFPLFSEIDNAFRAALQAETFSGAGLLIGTPDRVLLQNFWGLTRAGGIPVDGKTRFDLASLTKPLVTATLCLWAIRECRLGLDNPIAVFFPDVPADKRSITIQQLLNHCSGLASYQPYYRDLIGVPVAERRSKLQQWILHSSLIAAPGKESCYSDLGFLLLGMILEQVLEGRLDKLAEKILFNPLAVEQLEFVPLRPAKDPTVAQEPPPMLALSFAATENCPWRKRVLQGEVHDENAYCLEGVAAHAGLFGTALGVYSLLSCWWKVYQKKLQSALFSPDLVRTFWTPPALAPGSTWALGFDTPSGGQSSAGSYFSPRSIGHLGFTGTSFWIDLDQGLMVILLTNRVYPTRQNERIRQFRPLAHNLAMKAFHEFSKR
ncbi:MAG: serine hydrolase domain-containing protein [Desulforhabdus sp.]|jgi:CubicO group peptidase (beta-lactamase class C family)|nr:serine hydrolase domain-containing protein [Desulforhabdus sp.]